jgi:CRP/FNR family transcriptional regulator, cyclic AMP receptor protein
METACLFQLRCLSENKVIRAPKGTTILMPEQRTSFVYHVHEGVVGFFRTSLDGREVVEALMVPPLLIGFAGFAGMYSRRHIYHLAEARTITPVVYCKTKREAVWDLMDDREARAQIMDMICGTALLMGRIGGSPFASDIAPRILTILDVLGQSVSTRDTEGRIAIPGITHDDIAAMAKVTRPTVSRALEKLQRRGIIELARQRIILLKPEKLRVNPWA